MPDLAALDETGLLTGIETVSQEVYDNPPASRVRLPDGHDMGARLRRFRWLGGAFHPVTADPPDSVPRVPNAIRALVEVIRALNQAGIITAASCPTAARLVAWFHRHYEQGVVPGTPEGGARG